MREQADPHAFAIHVGARIRTRKPRPFPRRGRNRTDRARNASQITATADDGRPLTTAAMRVCGVSRRRDQHGCVSRFSDVWARNGPRARLPRPPNPRRPRDARGVAHLVRGSSRHGQRNRRTLAVAAAVLCVTALTTGTASGGGHVYSCSIYRAPIPAGAGDAILTFSNWVAPRAPGGAHGEPPYDRVGAAARLTVADPRSTDEWSTSRPRRFHKLTVACRLHFNWFGEIVTATVRSNWVDDPVCGYLFQHSGA
jgi:hypothetical protein